jgi:hypothetical protein
LVPLLIFGIKHKLKIIYEINKNKINMTKIKICMMKYDYMKYLWIKNRRKKN